MKSRLDRLEAKLGDGACPGPKIQSIDVELGQKPPPLPEVCNLCGRPLSEHVNANGTPRIHRIEIVQPGPDFPK
jgi:hypothetical protein